MNKKPLCAVYARVSTEDQQTSMGNQQDIFNKYIKEHDFELFDTYLDEAISGTKGYKRIDWQRLIEDIKNKRFNVLLVKSFSRFGRNQRETLDVIAKLKASSIRFIFIEDGIDSQRDTNTVGLMAWLSEQEAQRTSERLKLVWRKYNEDGTIHVCLPPYGYDYNSEVRNFIVNSEESEIICRIFGMYIQGFGYTKIANTLREEGIKTKKGGEWANATIRGMLSNESYMGTLIQGLSRTIDVTMNEREKVPEEKWHRHPNNHPAIISEDLFYKVQALMEERSKYAENFYQDGKKPKQASRHSNASLFSNLLKCGECGSTMSIKRKKNLNNYTPYYNCNSYELKGIKYSGHTSNFVWEEVLITIVKSDLEKQGENDFRNLKEMLRANKSNSQPKTVELELRTINSKIGQHLKLSMTLQMNHEKGLMGDMQFKLQNETIEKNLQLLISRKEILENMPKMQMQTNEEDILTEGIKELLSLPTEKWTNALLKVIVDKIKVSMNGVIKVDLKYLNNKDSNQCTSKLGYDYSDWLDRLLPVYELEEAG
jgi:DNA invertase Pin-like site-specific DNA recombinase